MPSTNQGEEVAVEGIVHSEARLEARRYKSFKFAADLLYLLRDDLRIKSWTSPNLEPSGLKISKVSGSLTNAVFFVSYPTIPRNTVLPRTILLRIYGPSSGSLISRPHELRTLHMLSSVYTIGPRVFGTFGNGRVEEFFDSQALTPEDLRNPQTSRWIARRMRELHRVDIQIVSGGQEWNDKDHAGDAVTVRKNVKDWFAPAAEVLELLTGTMEIAADLDLDEKKKNPWWRVKEDIDLDRFYREWDAYVAWLKDWEIHHSMSPRVFAHNDTQYGNLLRLANLKEGMPNHHQIIVVDFEYAAPNPAAFDIANHFLEWTADYGSSTPHSMDATKYPTLEQRRNFYRAYLSPVQPPATFAGKATVTESPGILAPAPHVSSSSSSSLPAGSPAVPALTSIHGLSTSVASAASTSVSASAVAKDTSLRNTSSSSIALNEALADSKSSNVSPIQLDKLEEEVRVWTPAALAQWTIWGLVQARDDVMAGGIGEFDYLNYSRGRVRAFREELIRLGVIIQKSPGSGSGCA